MARCAMSEGCGHPDRQLLFLDFDVLFEWMGKMVMPASTAIEEALSEVLMKHACI
jgi:hypothetical protein